jgi:SPP1 family phage portal protein
MQFNNNVNMLTQEEIIKIYIDEFNSSEERKLMLKGDSYYRVENDILKRKMYRYEDEKPVEDVTKTNNKLAHGFMHTLVDDKVNYLLVKPYTLECDDDNYLRLVYETLGKRFQKKLSQLGTESSNKGIAWLHVYIDKQGNLKTMRIPSEQCIPLWLDNDHEELEAMIRYYDVEVYEGREKKYITKIEYWTPDNVEYYVMENGQVILDAESYLAEDYDGHYKSDEVPGAWRRVPYIPFKNNDFELPDLQFVKTLVDNYDITRSDIANLLEDVKNIIFVLRGYGGERLDLFMKDLAYYRAVKTDEDGGVDKIETTINIDAAKEHYQSLKKDIYDFGQGVDKNSDKLGNSPSGIALKFIYSGLDLKCNAVEDNFKWAFEELLYFVNKYLELTKQPISDKEINIIFNRDIAINESQAITDCMNSMGVISQETIVANHPWVEDVEKELNLVKQENTLDETDMFGNNKGEGDD